MDAQQAIERLYEDESLTSALDDTAAQPLMRWAERQLERLAPSAPDEPRFEQDFAALRKLIKRIGRYIDRRREWSEAEQADELDVIKHEAESISAPLTIATPADYARKPAVEVVVAMIGANTTPQLTGITATSKQDVTDTHPIPIQLQEQQGDDYQTPTDKGAESKNRNTVSDIGKTKPLPSLSNTGDTAPLGSRPRGGQSIDDVPDTLPKRDGFLGDLIKRIFEE